jgi:hypothetical protein
MDSRIVIVLCALGMLLAGSAIEAAEIMHRRCGLYEQKTLMLWPGQEPPDEEEEEGPIETDRPDFTEASSTVGRGRVQLELGYTYIRDDEDGSSVRAHSFPETLLRVGMFADWFEFRIAWNFGVHRETQNGISITISEPEDLYLGVKLALTEQDGIWPEMALLPQMTVPTAPVTGMVLFQHPLPTDLGGFGTGEVMPGINWLYGWDVTESWTAAGSTQVNRALDDSGVFYEEFAQSVTIGYGWTERLRHYTEWFAFFPHGAADPGTRPEHYFNGGFTYLVTDNFQLDIRAGVGLNSAAGDFFAGAGAAYRY